MLYNKKSAQITPLPPSPDRKPALDKLFGGIINNFIYRITKIPNKNTRLAFTLAEVLITLSIVGIVAAITLSTVIEKHREKETVAKLKKAYSEISQSFTLAVQENGTPDTWGMGGMYDKETHIILANKFKPYLKIIKDCVGKSSSYTSNNCTSVFNTESNYASVVDGNGVTLIFKNYLPSCSLDYGAIKNACGIVMTDINGKKSPNKLGYDIFIFVITKNKIVPRGIQSDRVSFEQNCDMTASNPDPNHYSLEACAAWVIYNENMDYLHCQGLSWEGAHSCKELKK